MWTPRENPLRSKSFAFSIRIVKAYSYLQKKNEYVMSKQLLRCGTSIGANIQEALQAQSKKDFVAKLQISMKEAFESKYWIQLMQHTSFLSRVQANSLLQDLEELLKLLTAIIKTSKSRMKK
ncbi:MAG: four helix bundle protein [Candidatus Peribacteraceae bacterium]